MLARLAESLLLVIDMQPTFLDGCWQAEQVFNRSKFIVECATILGVPTVATEQNPERMGRTEPSLAALIESDPLAKLSFSCCGSSHLNDHIKALSKKQVIIVGIETHICVNQTAHHLVENGYEVIVCPDAVTARTEHRHKEGIKRLRDLGVTLAHSEAVVYEWMQSANHPKFKDVLAIVKRYA